LAKGTPYIACMRDITWTWVGLFGLGVAALVFLLLRTFPGVIDQQDAQMRLVYGVALLALVGSSAVLGWRENAGLALRPAMTWVAIALVLVIGYGYREEFSGLMTRTQSELLPTRATEVRHGTVSLGGDGTGHFLADAKVDGTPVRFLVDTGASPVALTPFAAQRLGYGLAELEYPGTLSNGERCCLCRSCDPGRNLHWLGHRAKCEGIGFPGRSLPIAFGHELSGRTYCG